MPESKRRQRSGRRRDDGAGDAEGRRRSRSLWSGTIGFGLVSIPVELLPASRPRRISLRMLGPDGHPLQRRYYDPGSGEEVPFEELERGYETAKDEFVPMKDEELEGLLPKKSRDIELTRFVDAAEIDPMYFERAYFLLPSGDSNKAYRLLAATMEKTGRAGIATFVMRDKEYRVAILSQNGILRAETMRFADEVRTPASVGLPKRKEPSEKDVRLFEAEIERHAARSLKKDDLEDAQAERLVRLAQQKVKKDEDVVRVEEPALEADENVIDLMSMLKKSLAASNDEGKTAARRRGKPGVRKTGGKASAGRAPRARRAAGRAR